MIADEVTDSHPNQEIVSLYFRFVDCSLAKAEVKESFVDFIHFERATGQNLADCIVSMLVRLGLPIEDMRLQAYDGAATMSSSNVGVQANMKRLNPWLSTSIAIVEKMVGYINDVFLFYHLPPKRQRFLENKRHKLNIKNTEFTVDKVHRNAAHSNLSRADGYGNKRAV